MSSKYGWWKIGGRNQQAVYGYGSEAEANAYRDYLNRGKEIDLCDCEYLPMAGFGDIDAEVVSLGEAPADIDN